MQLFIFENNWRRILFWIVCKISLFFFLPKIGIFPPKHCNLINRSGKIVHNKMIVEMHVARIVCIFSFWKSAIGNCIFIILTTNSPFYATGFFIFRFFVENGSEGWGFRRKGKIVVNFHAFQVKRSCNRKGDLLFSAFFFLYPRTVYVKRSGD